MSHIHGLAIFAYRHGVFRVKSTVGGIPHARSMAFHLYGV